MLWRQLLSISISVGFLLACAVHGERPIVLFESALDERGLKSLAAIGGEQCFIIYQGDADPDAYKTGTIDISKLAKHVIDRQGDQPAGWGILDFEDPFGQRLTADPGGDEWKRTTATMVEAIRAMKRLFPKVRWAYYGIPGHQYYLADGSVWKPWPSAPQAVRDGAMKRMIQAFAPIVAESDWLAPSLYYKVSDGSGSKVPPDELRHSTRSWVSATMELCRAGTSGTSRPLPVIPFVSPLFMPGGGAPAFEVVPAQVSEEDIIAPALAGGARGFCIWTGASSFIPIANGTSKGVGFSEGGGKQALVSAWSRELGVPPAALEGKSGREMLNRLVSGAQVAFAEAAIRRAERAAAAPSR